MSMEKRGVISPGLTPDTEGRLPGQKMATAKREQVRELDDDATKRLADRAAAGAASPQ